MLQIVSGLMFHQNQCCMRTFGFFMCPVLWVRDTARPKRKECWIVGFQADDLKRKNAAFFGFCYQGVGLGISSWNPEAHL